jgi:hypothetical protein
MRRRRVVGKRQAGGAGESLRDRVGVFALGFEDG